MIYLKKMCCCALTFCCYCSCSPNLVSHQVLIESMDCERSHIGFYASRDVSALL